jgi:uncharacterized DUF497 family protein
MITFGWDEAKNRRNQRKHGVRFQDARRVFDDPNALMALDDVERGEERWRAIGRVDAITVVVVAYAVRIRAETEAIRIISARKASQEEFDRYEAQTFC